MVDDILDLSRARLVSACNLWLAAEDITNPVNFYEQTETIRHDATAAADHAALQTAADRLVLLTGTLAAADWDGYERRHKETQAQEPHPRSNTVAKPSKNSRSSALRNF